MSTPLKHRWSVTQNHLTGMTAGGWWRLLRENQFDVDFAYAHRVALISVTSVMNSLSAAIEHWRFGKALREVGEVPPPLFILGHWRSGTTHLHNLLALDSEQFAYPNTYQVVSPFTFLSTEALNSRLFGWMVAKKRPMDNMDLSFASPQEDEMALCLLSRRSPYLVITFPRRHRQYDRYLTLRDLAPRELEEWKSALMLFMRKLTYKYARPLLLKSPTHTARIALLLSMFPRARFVHIHRDPYTVFQSSRHYFATAPWHTYLQKPVRDEELTDAILQRYTALHEAFFEQKGLIPPGQFHELAFDDLTRDPVGQIRLIYDRLGLPGFDRVRPRLDTYLASQKDYQRNTFMPLAPALRQRIAEAWERCFAAWGYAT